MSRCRALGEVGLLAGAICALALALSSCSRDQFEGPKAEVGPHNIKLDLPALPAFELPPPEDGAHSVKELRVKGKKMLNTELTVKGYVTWVYDCPTAIRQAGWTDKQVAAYIEANPQKCDRPKFYLGDTPDTSPELSLWVVNVPRPPNKAERERLPRDQLRFWPAVPPYKVGDQMTVTGEFKLSSPQGERHTDGLVVYKSLHNVTQDWTTPPPDPADPRNQTPPATRQPPAGAH